MYNVIIDDKLKYKLAIQVNCQLNRSLIVDPRRNIILYKIRYIQYNSANCATIAREKCFILRYYSPVKYITIILQQFRRSWLLFALMPTQWIFSLRLVAKEILARSRRQVLACKEKSTNLIPYVNSPNWLILWHDARGKLSGMIDTHKKN